jgi:hypothetical protein
MSALGGDRSPMARQAWQMPHSNDGKHRITAGKAWSDVQGLAWFPKERQAWCH